MHFQDTKARLPGFSPPKRNFIGFKHPEFDEFVRLFTETTSKIKKNEIPVGTETIFKAMKLKDASLARGCLNLLWRRTS